MQNTYRPVAMVHFWHWLGASLVFLSPFFFLYLLLSWGKAGFIILGVLLIVGIGWLLRTYRLWRQSMMILDDDKIIIINQTGIFDRTVSQIQINKISDISFRKKGLWQTIGNFGSIAIQINSAAEKIIVNNLKHPETVQKELWAAQEEFASPTNEYSEAELLGIIREIRNRIGEPRWRQIQKGNWKLKQNLIDEVGETDKNKADAIEHFFSRKI